MRASARWICIVLALLFFMALWPMPSAYAAGVSVSAPGTVAVGDNVRVSVTFSGSQIMGVNASFSYDSSVLSFAGGSSSVSNGKIVLYASEGKSSLSVSMNFTAIAVGTSRISVSIDECLDENMNSLGGGSGAATVTVAAEKPKENKTAGPAGPTPKPTPTPVPVDQREIKAALGDDTVYIWHAIPDKLELPEGFAKSETALKGETVETLSREENAIVLVYCTDAKGENGTFALLRGETLLPYRTLKEAVPEIILLPVPEDAEIPQGFVAAEAVYEDAKISVLRDEKDPSSLLVYGWGADGRADWYLTDGSFESLTRYRQVTVEKTVEVLVTPVPVVTPRPTPVPTPEPTEEPAAEEPEDEGPSAALPWILFGVVSAALAGSWIFMKREAIENGLRRAVEWVREKMPKAGEAPAAEGSKAQENEGTEETEKDNGQETGPAEEQDGEEKKE